MSKIEACRQFQADQSADEYDKIKIDFFLHEYRPQPHRNLSPSLKFFFYLFYTSFLLVDYLKNWCIGVRCMLYKLKDSFQRVLFKQVAIRILQTAPTTLREGKALIVSLFSEKDVLLYLCAIKSFLFHFGKAQVTVSNDGSIKVKSKTLLSQHLLGLNIIPIQSIDSSPLPRRNCWERLFLFYRKR